MNNKIKILRKLIENKDSYISGEELATELNITRAAIGKVIQNFRNEGFIIDALNRAGYKYKKENDILSFETLEIYKKRDYKIFFYDEIDSTNNEAKRLINNGEKAPFIVVAKEQSTGRGRRGRFFLSPSGGTYLTLVIQNKDNTDLITTKTAVAVSRAIEKSTNKKTQIKWVNDLYYNDKKVCGILCEGIVNMELNSITDVVVGIGVNYQSNDIPTDIAISLHREDEKPLTTKAEFISSQVEEIFNTLETNDYLEEYKEKSFILGKDVLVIKNDEEIEAKALDIDDKAHLIVKYKNGEIETLTSGEISLRPLKK